MKVYLWLASIAGVLLALWYFHLWSYDQGKRDCEAAQQKVALEVTTGVLDQAGAINIADAALAVSSNEAVNDVRDDSNERLERIAVAPLSVGGSDAAPTVCPDALGPDFWRLYDAEPDGGGAAAPASSPAAELPRGG